MQKKKTKIANFSIYFLIFLVIFFGLSLIANIRRNFAIKERVRKEKEKVEILQKEKEELERKIAQTKSEEYMEKQLRDKLGLARQGEIVLVLPDEETLKKLVPEEVKEEEVLPDPTWKKWLKLFEINI